MQSADRYLVRKDLSLIQLFTPPFDKSDLNPGYIKGYVPGVRENGGQYTHAAIWLVMAFAAKGDHQKTWELLSMINPINHGKTPEDVLTYKVEPYVIAADVYAVLDYPGRGGWTWYTGSAGLMYQLVIEYFLGLKRNGNTLSFEPCIPHDWESVKIEYKYADTVYQIHFIHSMSPDRELKLTIDGTAQANKMVYLVNDKETHHVEVKLAAKLATHQGAALMKIDKG